MTHVSHKGAVLFLLIISLTLLHPASTPAFVSEEARAQLEALGIELLTADDIPYFSTGVGLETREEVTYPPFSLKLILAKESREYLSNVAIEIAPEGGSPILQATATGPWFFVDLETGIYRVVATSGGVEEVLRGVEVKKGQTTTEAILWP